MARAHVYYDRYGAIVSVVEISSDRSAPPAGVMAMDGIGSLETRLDDETILHVHASYRVELSGKQPKLVRKVPDKKDDKRDSSDKKSS